MGPTGLSLYDPIGRIKWEYMFAVLGKWERVAKTMTRKLWRVSWDRTDHHILPIYYSLLSY